ncbi:MAG: hypothetical protein ACK41W_12035, partial [Cyanobacteriota bacterium]
RGWLEDNAEAFKLPRDSRGEAGQWAGAGGEEQKGPYLLRGGRLARARVVSQRGWSVMGGPSTASPSAARGICWPPPPRTTPRASAGTRIVTACKGGAARLWALEFRHRGDFAGPPPSCARHRLCRRWRSRRHRV